MPRRVLIALTASLLAVGMVAAPAWAAAPDAPALNYDINAGGTVDLVWTPEVGATQYRIFEYIATPSNGTGAGVATVTDTRSNRGPLAANQQFGYFVKAINAAGELSAESNRVVFTVTDDPSAGRVSSVTFDTPATDATVSGDVNFNATCPTTTECSLMSYRVDGQVVATDGAGDNADGFAETWDSRTVANGKHYIQAGGTKASTGAELVTAPRAITVNNTTPPPPPPVKPDLTPELPGVDGDNTVTDVVAGEQVRFNGNWNVADAPSNGDNVIRWFVDDVERGNSNIYYGQQPGGYGSISTGTWTATEGAHVLRMVVDSNNAIDESNETNNQSTRSFTVGTGTPPPPPPPAVCGDGLDNDGDGKVDFPADPGCTSATDTDEADPVTPPPPPPPAEPALPAGGAVPAADETQAFASGTGDIADDPAIWVNPADPAQSLVIGSKKAASGGGLAGYTLDGNQLWFLGAGELNNVDIRTVGGKVVVVATERGSNTLRFFYLNPSTRTLTAAGSIATGFEPYGGCLGVSGSTLYAFVTNRAGSFDFDQYGLTVGASTVTGSKVRDMTTSSLSEACVADDAGGHVYLSQETSGVYRYGLAPSSGSARTTVGLVSDPNLTADVEGLGIAYPRTAGGPKYLTVSSQGANNYQVYDITGAPVYKKTFTVAASGSVDAVTGTDGLEVTRANLGTLFPDGLLVVHDTTNSGGNASNFKFVDAGKVYGAYGAGTTPPPPPPPPPGQFAHPGVLVSQGQLNFVKAKIAAGAQPWTDYLAKMKTSDLASPTYTPHPVPVVECGPFSNPDVGCSDEKFDFTAAYTQALLWAYEGNQAAGQKSIQIMNAWSAVLTDHTNSNSSLQASWTGLMVSRAGDIMRTSGLWAAADQQRFGNMLRNVHYPETTPAYNNSAGNWGLSATEARMGIAVFLDDRALFDEAVSRWRTVAPGYIATSGQTDETCRDQGHTWYGLASMTNAAETAQIQGVDLYGEIEAKLVAAYEFNTDIIVDGYPSGLCSPTPDGTDWRKYRTGEVGFNELQTVRGHAMPNTLRFLNLHRAEGGTGVEEHMQAWESLSFAQTGQP